MTDESALLEAAARYDTDTLAAIFDHYAPILYKYALNLCHDSVDADNVVGDVFAQLLEQLSAGKGPRTNLRSYLYQIAYHLIVNRIRDSYHVTPVDEVNDLYDQSVSVSGQVEDLETMEMLRAALQKELTEEQRHVVVLRFMEGFSLQETATITGKSVNAIKVLQNRGIARLRQVLNKNMTLAK